MEGAFIYSTPVIAKNFIGRKNEVTVTANLLGQCENIVMYEPPKTGKHSVLNQALYNMKGTAGQFSLCEFSLMNIRTTADFVTGLGGQIIRSVFSTPGEYASAVENCLSGTHLVFDPEAYSSCGSILSLNWDIDMEDVRAVLNLPYAITAGRDVKLYIVIDEFQNILKTEDGDSLCRLFEEVVKLAPKGRCAFVLIGSEVNAMKYIFEQRGYFRRMVNRIALEEIDAKEAIDFTVRGFLTSGKVVDRDLMLGACKLFKSNLWYINHFCAISDSLSRGYIMEPVLDEALGILVAIHEPRFKAIMNDLTTFQICMLRAIIDGHTRFSSAEVIQRYNLNSSANVRRLKDALCRKEIITFDDKDNPVILDPLFEYWVTKSYFKI